MAKAYQKRRVATAPPGQNGGPSWLRIVYWMMPLILTGLQAKVSLASTHQIRYEELAESVRSVFWLDHRMVYDGVYTNVGWYATLLVVYKLFGFSLFTAKAVRVVLHLIALCAVADLLRRFLPLRAALVPLLLIGVSPTLLYFDTFATSYGLDLTYVAICLWTLLSVRPESSAAWNVVKIFLFGAVAMFAAMSYPTFLFYLPSLLMVAVWWFRRTGSLNVAYVASAAIGFALPLLAIFLFVRTRGLLLYDPVTQAGLFRGGGRLGFDLATLASATGAVVHDLFVQGQTYYVEMRQPEFSDWIAVAGLLLVIATAAYGAFSRKMNRTAVGAALLLLIVSLVVPGLSDGPPGIRRSTGVIAAYFVLFALVWHFYLTEPSLRRWPRRIGLSVCMLLLVDTGLKMPSVQLDAEADSVFRNTDWFAIEATPTASLDRLLAQRAQGQPLSCPVDQSNHISPCRYQEIYAAMGGYLTWNRLGSESIQAVDWKTGRDITLTRELWNTNYYPTCTRVAACR